MKIKAIFFDIDNTLYPTKEFAERARRNAVNAMRESGLQVSEEKAYRTLIKIIKKRTSNYDYHFDEMLKELGVKPSPRIVAAGIAAYHNTKSTILPFPEVTRTLLFLRDADYKIYAASEGFVLKQWDKLIRLGLYQLFHDVFVTQTVCKNKSKEFYVHILKELKLNPKETLMIGDSIDRDITPAKKAGMRTVLVSGKRKKDGADYCIKNLSELPKILSEMM